MISSSELFEEAVSVAASFACTLLTQESLLDLLFVGPQSYCFTAGRGVAHADQMLEILASVQACADQPFRALEHLVLNHVGVVSGCICVLVAWDEPRRSFVEKLRALGLPVRCSSLCHRAKARPWNQGRSATSRNDSRCWRSDRLNPGWRSSNDSGFIALTLAVDLLCFLPDGNERFYLLPARHAGNGLGRGYSF